MAKLCPRQVSLQYLKLKVISLFFLVNSGVMLFKPVYFKDNGVVSKWYNIGPKFFLVPIYV